MLSMKPWKTVHFMERFPDSKVYMRAQYPLKTAVMSYKKYSKVGSYWG